MGLLDLFIAASMPVLKVLLVTALGSFLALDHINLLGEDARKHLNSIVFYVFNPALVAGNLANTITYDSMVKLWFMPVNILITFIIGSVLGWLVILITRPPPHLRGLVIGCSAAGNLGNILIIIVPAVCKEKGSPFGDPDVCRTYALAYASLSMAIGAIYLWVYVYNIIRISIQGSLKKAKSNDSSVIKATSESSIEQPESLTEPLVSSKDLVTSKDHADALPITRIEGKTQLTFTAKIKQNVVEISNKLNLNRLFAPSTNGAIVGFTVGLVPLLRKLMIGDDAPLRVIEDSTVLLGDGAIPALTLIIGANLLKGLRATGIQKSMVAGIVIARFVCLPLLGIFIVKGALRFNLVQADPLYQFVLLLQFAVPPAMNIGTITQLFGVGETECSVILLWTYIFASVSLTLWCTFFMWLVSV